MKTTGFALVSGAAAALLLSGVAGGCGGITALLPEDGGTTDGHPSSGSGSSGASSTSSSSGIAGSSSGGGSTSSSGISSSSSSGTSGSSGSGGSSSSSGVSSSSSSGGSSSGGSNTGAIYFQQCTDTALCGQPTFEFYASFGQDGSSNPGCTVTTSGACAVTTCMGTQMNPIGVSAGTLTIGGGSLGSGVTVTPDGTNTYQYQSMGTLFSAGQALTVEASGATVPAFGPVSVVAPGLPILTAPAGAATGAYTISTKSDLKVAWSGGESSAQVIFEGASNNSASYFTCVWASSLGEATVPQAMLAPLAGQGAGYLVYGQYTSTSFNAGAYSLSAQALPYSGGTATFD